MILVALIDLLNMIMVGCLYTMMAIPLTLSFRVTKFINFAHTIFLAYGAYVAVLLTLFFTSNIFLVLISAFAFCAVLGALMHILVFKPIQRRENNTVMWMISSLGLWIFLKYLLYGILSYLQTQLKVELYLAKPKIDIFATVPFMGVNLSGIFQTVVATTVVVMLSFYILMFKTRIGLSMRAVSENAFLSEIVGLNKNRIMLLTWAITGGMASVGGVMYALFAQATPETGDTLILQLFAASVIGGLYSLPLTVVGAFTVSFAENIVTSALHDIVGLELSFRPFISFSILLLVILAKPPLGAGGGLPYRFRKKKADKN